MVRDLSSTFEFEVEVNCCDTVLTVRLFPQRCVENSPFEATAWHLLKVEQRYSRVDRLALTKATSKTELGLNQQSYLPTPGNPRLGWSIWWWWKPCLRKDILSFVVMRSDAFPAWLGHMEMQTLMT